MPRLLTLSRAARLVGVKRGALQTKIRQGELRTFEGELLLSDLLHAYPQTQIEDTTMIERVEQISGLSARAQNAVVGFRFLIAKHASKAASHPADEVARALIQETGILQDLRKENTPEGLMRWENVQELINAIAEFTEGAGEEGTLSGFL